MGEFFRKDYTGAPFELFGPVHLLTLGLILALNLWILFGWRNISEPAKRNFRYGMAGLLVVNETAYHLWNWATGQWTIQTMLPLHLCSVLVWTSVFMLAARSYRVYEFAYFLGIGGAMQALLTPDAGIYGFPHFRYLQTMISHGAIVTAAVYMTAIEGFRPYWSSLLRVAIYTNIYLAVVAVVNTLVGSNYLYIAHKPATASLIDVLGPWPWYILSLEAVALTVCLILYLPYAFRDWRAKQSAAPAVGS